MPSNATPAVVNHNRPPEHRPAAELRVVFGSTFPTRSTRRNFTGHGARRGGQTPRHGGHRRRRPEGLTLALDLANHGIASVVIEADATVCPGSRAGAFTRRTLEIMDQLGVADQIVASGLGWNRGWTYFRDALVAESRIPDSPDPRFRPRSASCRT